MGDLSLVFHVFSLLAFMVFGFVVLRLLSDLRLWREWNTGSQGQRINVGPPIRMLRRFASAIDADFESELGDDALPIGKLRLHSCFALHKSGGIKKILVTKREITRVDFVLVREPSIMPIDLEQITHELGGGIEVAVSISHRP